MQQTVLLFARVQELAGTDRLEVTLPPHALVSELKKALIEKIPALASLAGSLFIAVNNTYAVDQDEIPPQAEIACFPPVSGG